MKKGKKVLSAILAATFVVGSMPYPVSAATSEIDQKLHDNGFTLYTVNCGTPDASVVPTGYRMGVCQSNVDQKYGKDATTGLNWGYVENANSKLATKGDANATDIQSSLRDMVFDETTTYDAEKSAIEYDFDLPQGITAKTFKVTLGVKVPAWWGDKNKNYTRNEDIYVNDQKVGNNIPYTQGALVEKNYDVTVTNETQLKIKMKATNRTNDGQQDPLIGYILIQTPEQYTVQDCQNKKAAYTAAMEGKKYSTITKADYDKAVAAVDALTEASSATDINTAYRNLVTAYGNLKEVSGSYTSFMGTDCDGAGRQMQDTNGNDIQAHGGQIFELNGTYYWYGEDKSSGLAPTGVHMYSSKDLYNWTDGGVALKTLNSMDDFNQEPYKTLYGGYTDDQKKEVFRALDKNTAVVERPKVIYNAKNKQYVMWFHADGPLKDGDSPHSYGKAMAGVAVSDKPEGPFKFLSESRLHTSDNYTGDAGHKGMSRDMNLYLDDKDSNGDGVPDAYILYTSIGLDGTDNGAIYISRLNADYTALDKPQGEAVEGKDFAIAYNAKREGEAIFKYQSKYYLVTSACNGWAPTNSKYAVSDSPLGPWTDVKSPFVDDGSATSYETQSTCFITVDAAKGKFIYLGDRWNYKDVSHIGDSRYVFLPVDFGANNTMILHDVKNWTLDRLGQNPGFTVSGVSAIPKTTSDLTQYMNALPKTLPVKMATESQAKDVQITWSNDVNTQTNPYAISANITGKLAGIDEPVEFTTAITSPKAVYFFDCGRDVQGTSSDYFDKIKNCPAMKNKTADQKYTDGSLWGRTSVTNKENLQQYDVGYAPTAGPDVWSTGLWAAGGKTIDYAAALDAGTYTACAGFQEWWNSNRNLKFAVLDESGKELAATPVAITGKTTNDIHAVSFTLDKTTKVKLCVSKTDSGSDAVLSWYEILQNDLGTLDSGMIGYYPLTSDANDASGSGNNGKITGTGIQFTGNCMKMPGGAFSTNNYVQLPNGMFDKKDTLTVSMLLKNETGAGDYAATYFGNTKAASQTDGNDHQWPNQYWLLNPQSSSSKFKTVMTAKASKGWDSEVGIDGKTQGGTTDSNWSLYTVVIQPKDGGCILTGYLNGKKQGSMDCAEKVSDFGSNLVAYIGADAYGDKLLQGSVCDVRVYSKALADSDITELYNRSMSKVAAMDAGALNIANADTVTADFSLPTAKNGSTVTWTSSDETCAKVDGANAKITQPDSTAGDKKVTLTATVSYGGQTVTKIFNLTIKVKLTDAEIIQKDLDALSIPNADGIRGNIDLPVAGKNGSKISWKSSNTAVINPNGTVTRPATNTAVTLTATAESGMVNKTKDFQVTVLAKAAQQKYAGYLFAYFTGQSSATQEQVYFGLSKDGCNWQQVNGTNPILTSKLGETGVRDPFIMRSPEGDKFYLIATDLSIFKHNDWGKAQTDGSKSIMIWESTDLVNWSDQRMVKIAADNAGCTWAPEAVYDDQTKQYVMFWASSIPVSKGGDAIQRIYCATTKDFYTFSEPKLYYEMKGSDGKPTSVIDTTFQKSGSKWYRWSKVESYHHVIEESSDSLFGTWTKVSSDTLAAQDGVEAPTCFKLNDQNKWCLLLDAYSSGGYYPLTTDDLSTANFTKLNKTGYKMPGNPETRHGTVIPVTQEEYDRIVNNNKVTVEKSEHGTVTASAAQVFAGGTLTLTAQPDDGYELTVLRINGKEVTVPKSGTYSYTVTESGAIAVKAAFKQRTVHQEPVLSYNFDETQNGTVKDVSGTNDGKLFGTAKYVQDDAKHSQVLSLDGGKDSYLSFPQGFFDGRSYLTLSMDLKTSLNNGNCFTVAIGQDNSNYYLMNALSGSIKSVLSVGPGAGWSHESGLSSLKFADAKDQWMNIAVTFTPTSMSVYRDGKLLGTCKGADMPFSISSLGNNTLAYLGKSFYDDPYWKGCFDNVKVYDRALSADEIALAASSDPLADAVEALTLPATTVAQDISLPNTAKYGAKVTWKSSDERVVSNTGKVTRPATGAADAQVVLTATVTYGGKSKTKDFKVTVLAQAQAYVLAYTTGGNDEQASLHLAYSADGKAWTPLNGGNGVCYATIPTDNGSKDLDTGYAFQSPYLFRKPDGTFGMIAVKENDKSFYVYDSKDLTSFTGERLIASGAAANPIDVQCVYDDTQKAYIISWTAGGKQYAAKSADLKVISNTAETSYSPVSVSGAQGLPQGAVGSCLLAVKTSELNTLLTAKFGAGDSVTAKTVTVQAGQKPILPSTVTDKNGNTVKVTWNTDGMDFPKAGTYQISGTVGDSKPLIAQRADPYIVKADDGYYYFTASYPAVGDANHGYDRIILRRAKTIGDLADAEEKTIWSAHTTGIMAKHVWAPEMHQIGGKWYLFFAAGASDNIWAIRPYVLQCSGSDPYADTWVEKGQVQNMPVSDSMALDMTYFEHGGKSYVVWAQINGKPSNGSAIGPSSLYLSEVDPSAPYVLKGNTVCVSTPQFAWERSGEIVNEGPAVLEHNGKIFVTFSASGTGEAYCIGLLTADASADLLNPNSWSKTAYPILSTADLPGESGPGHNCFTVDENGNTVIVYHSRVQGAAITGSPLYDPNRNAHVRPVSWAADGTPVLKPASAIMTVKVTGGGSVPTTPGNGDETEVVVNDSKDKASVTTKPSSVTENGNKAEIKVDVPAVDKQLDSSKNATVDVKLPTDALVEETGKKKTVETVVSLPSSLTENSKLTVNVTVSKDVFVSAKKNSSNIKIFVKDANTQQMLVSWSFGGEELTASGAAAADVNLAVKLQRSSEVASVEKQAPKENGVVVTFSHSGFLPAAARVTLPVKSGSYKPGQVLYLYYQEPANGRLIYQDQTCTVVNDGTVEVQITHCSNYVLLPQKLAETFKSDTNSDFAVDRAYTFKITSLNGKLPNLVIGTSGVFKTALVGHQGNDYFYKITAIGKPGQKAGVYVNGERLLAVTVKSSAPKVICDTTHPFTVKQNGSYTFKLTAEQQPTFVCGSGNVFKVAFVKKTGNQYFYKVMAAGKLGEKAGFYINGDKKPVVTAAISK